MDKKELELETSLKGDVEFATLVELTRHARAVSRFLLEQSIRKQILLIRLSSSTSQEAFTQITKGLETRLSKDFHILVVYDQSISHTIDVQVINEQDLTPERLEEITNLQKEFAKLLDGTSKD